MPSVLQFIQSLKLDKADEAALVQHVQDCYGDDGGPGLDDRCTDHVRRYLQRHPPQNLSWRGTIKLDDELTAGFTSKQAFKMGIPAIGIVAVLVANVTFIAYATPPGGPSPYWLGCDYPVFTAFLIVNGVAFVLSVASAIVVTAFPLLLRRNPHQAAYWGGTLLLLSLIAFIVAFLLAGFVTVAYKAPAAGCAALTCEDGGVVCSTAVINNTNTGFYLLDPNQAALNNLASNGTDAICLRYSTAEATNATTMTLIPALINCAGTSINSEPAEFLNCTDVRDLLEDDRVQQEVLCTGAYNFPRQLPTQDTTNYTIPFDAENLQGYASLDEWYNANPLHFVTDLLSNVNSQGLQSYAGFSFQCFSRENDTSKAFNPLCDTSQQPALAVTKAGQYMTEATASTSGARVFRIDITSTRVAHALEALTGFFGLVLLLIFGYLITARTSY